MNNITPIKTTKPRSRHSVSLDRNTSHSLMSSPKYRHGDAKDYFKNHKPYCCDIKKGE